MHIKASPYDHLIESSQHIPSKTPAYPSKQPSYQQCLVCSSLQGARVAVGLESNVILIDVVADCLVVGRELAQVLLDAGENVVATARKPTTITSFRNASESNFLPLKLDVTKQSDIKAAFADAVSKFGRIDVLINNAAYCLAGPFETLSESQIRSQFDTNVFAVMEITRGALEIMRTQSPSGGLIMQNSSISGQLSFPLVSVYSASKFAVSGWTLGIAAEVKPEWNIKFCVVEPGPFRTPGVGSNLVVGDLPNKHYDHLDARAFFDTMDGKQPGDTT